MKYVLLLRNDPQGARSMLMSGSEGAAAQRRLLASLGADEGSVVQLAVTGRYDEVILVDFPDDRSALAFSLGATATGQYVEVLHAMTADDVDAARDLAAGAVSLGDDAEATS